MTALMARAQLTESVSAAKDIMVPIAQFVKKITFTMVPSFPMETCTLHMQTMIAEYW